jgi:hypothetical protein
MLIGMLLAAIFGPGFFVMMQGRGPGI